MSFLNFCWFSWLTIGFVQIGHIEVTSICTARFCSLAGLIAQLLSQFNKLHHYNRLEKVWSSSTRWSVSRSLTLVTSLNWLSEEASWDSTSSIHDSRSSQVRWNKTACKKITIVNITYNWKCTENSLEYLHLFLQVKDTVQGNTLLQFSCALLFESECIT